MLAGEYAVVGDHGPALSVALSRRVSVSCHVEGSEWRVSSPELGLEGAPLTSVPVLACAAASLEPHLPAGGLLTVESALGSGPTKPGFGSSAAVGVAGLAALCEASGLAAPSLEHAVAVHREAQGGRGSGYDVATALYGGVCAYRGATGTPVAEALTWLDGLHAAVVFTGRGASTPRHLSRLAEAGGDAVPLLRALGRASEGLLTAWREKRLANVLEAVQGAEDALDRLDERFTLGIRGGGIREAKEAIEGAGAFARTSGAGGGDCLWAFASDAVTLERALDAVEAAGAQRVEVQWPGCGLEVEVC